MARIEDDSGAVPARARTRMARKRGGAGDDDQDDALWPARTRDERRGACGRWLAGETSHARARGAGDEERARDDTVMEVMTRRTRFSRRG
jgi:hypothetical protein